MAKSKKRVKSFEVSKAHGGYKVRVEHHPKHESGKGMKGMMGSYEPPEDHVHTSPTSLHRHIKELTSSMSVSPDGDGEAKYPDSVGNPAQESATNE